MPRESSMLRLLHWEGDAMHIGRSINEAELPFQPSVATIPAPNPRLGLENVAPTDTVLGPLTPEELLVAIHLLEFAKDPNAPPSSTASGETASPAKPLVDIRIILRACLYCFSERRLFTQERLSAAIGQLLDQPVLPTLFLRTVMQALALYPRLAGYVINVLFRLIRKQVSRLYLLRL
ncbi:unnamed protein product [Dibothriocephalus latus]|uniref:Symplekin C-terminal domain-containing protein n=1 Tax=Dibothriocephalus latus TaxID=60516 RepID=A0A3P7LYM2_DIBLA|nr:unnamed protein product [Dibothriocephalus latus]